MLASRQPMWVWWGPELINFYNDAYRFVLQRQASRRPGPAGAPGVGRNLAQIQGRIDAAMAGEASYSEAELLIMHRSGYPEETYYTFSFSPVPEEDGAIGGIVCANTDDTDRVIGARRLALLRELASRTWEADTVADVFIAVGPGAGDRSARHAFRADLSAWKTTAPAPRCAAPAASKPAMPRRPTASRWTAPRPGRSSEVMRTGARAAGRHGLRRNSPICRTGPGRKRRRRRCCCRCPPAPMPRRAAC